MGTAVIDHETGELLDCPNCTPTKAENERLREKLEAVKEVAISERLRANRAEAELAEVLKEDTDHVDLRPFFDYWLEQVNLARTALGYKPRDPARTKLTPKRQKHLRARLKENKEHPDDIWVVIDGIAWGAHLDEGMRYDDLSVATRDPDQWDKYRERGELHRQRTWRSPLWLLTRRLPNDGKPVPIAHDDQSKQTAKCPNCFGRLLILAELEGDPCHVHLSCERCSTAQVLEALGMSEADLSRWHVLTPSSASENGRTPAGSHPASGGSRRRQSAGSGRAGGRS